MNSKQIITLMFSFLSINFAYANVIGPDTQNFNPTTNGLDFITVESSEILDPGILNMGLFYNSAKNSLPRSIYKSTNKNTDFSDVLNSGDLSLGLGLSKSWDIGIGFSYLLGQDIRDQQGSQIGYFNVLGLNEIRLNSKYRFWGDDSHGVAVQFLANFNRIENNPFAGRGAGPTLGLMFIADTTIADYAVAFNLGYRKRNPGSAYSELPIIIEPFKDTYVASLAGSYHMSSIDTKIITEIYSSYPAQSYQYLFDRDASSMEFLFGAKHDVNNQLSIHAGVGSKILNGSNTPDQRWYIGANYNIGPLWKKTPRKIKSQKIEKKEFYTFVLGSVVFETGSDIPTEDSLESIQDLANYVKENPDFKMLLIEGHTDSVGSRAKNMKLSQLRAERIRDILITDYGIPVEKIKAKGYGPDRPIADNGNYQGRLTNRRVEVQFEW